MKRPLYSTVLALILAAASAGAPCGEKAEPAEKKPAKKPEAAEFVLADGSKISGKVDFKEISMTTEYGKLTVPLGHLISLRIGRGSDKRANARIEALIKKLGSADFKERQQATEALTELGHEALDLLRKATKSEDAEIKTRAEKLVAEIEKLPPPGEDEDEQGDLPLMGNDDEVVTRKFTARGKVEIESFTLATRYGSLTVPRSQVIKAVFAAPDDVSRRCKVTSANGTFAPVRTRVKLKRGDKVKITARGSIKLNNYNRVITPDGDRNYFGTNNNCPGMSLVYRIGSSGQWKPAARSVTFKADSAGELQVAVNNRSTSSSYTNGTGEWKVKVVVTPQQ